MPRHEPLAEGWGWLDVLVGQLDEDLVGEAVKQPDPQAPRTRHAFPPLRYQRERNPARGAPTKY